MARRKARSTSPTIWLPHYPRDFSQKTEAMTAAEVGALILLMGSYWVSECKLPIESDRLRRIARMTRAEWNKSADTVLSLFELTESGYRHTFLDDEYEKACELSLQNSEKGKRSAEIRRNSKLSGQPVENVEKNGNCGTTPADTEQATEHQPKRNPSPSPSPIPFLDEDSSIPINKIIPEKTIASDRPKAGAATSGRRNVCDDAEFETFWDKYPRRVSKGRARRAFAAARRKTDLKTILAALNAASWPADMKFCPHPSTWLNDERWTDQATKRPMSENDRRIAELQSELQSELSRNDRNAPSPFDGKTIDGEYEPA